MKSIQRPYGLMIEIFTLIGSLMIAMGEEKKKVRGSVGFFILSSLNSSYRIAINVEAKISKIFKGSLPNKRIKMTDMFSTYGYYRIK